MQCIYNCGCVNTGQETGLREKIIVGEKYMIVAAVIIGVALVVTILACCKISGDCSKAEEERDELERQ